MRITFVLPSSGFSGGNRVVSIYARLLRERGHQVSVIARSSSRPSFAKSLKTLLKGRGWPSGRNVIAPYLQSLNPPIQLSPPGKSISDEDVPDGDVVIATWWETAEWVSGLKASKGTEVYFIQHHEIFPYLPVERSKATYRLPLHKIVIAKGLEDVMREEYGDNNVYLVPNSVDRAQFYSRTRSKQVVPTVGFLYSATEFKGVQTSIEILNGLRKEIPSLGIVSFGAIDPIPRMPLPAKTIYFHDPRQDIIRDIYSRCDVWLTASTSEGFNLPAMEAMACRTPVVSTRTGWPAEAILNGWNGWLADVGDKMELVKGIKWVLSQSEAEWRQVSENAFSTVADSSWEASAGLFDRALTEIRARDLREANPQ